MPPTVNQLKAARGWDEAANFDSEKDKSKFRQYEDACDRVKSFYKEQHGRARDCHRVRIELTLQHACNRKTDYGVQH